MEKRFQISRPLAAGTLGVALVLTMALFAVMADTDPYIGIGGSEIRVVRGEDGEDSYQLLVDVAVGNVPDSGMLAYLTAFLDFNNNYLKPSKFEDNSLFDYADEDYNGNPSFRSNPELNFTDPDGQEQGPFQIFAYEDVASTVVGENSQLVGINWGLKILDDYIVETDMLGTLIYDSDRQKNLYIKAAEKEKVLLGQLSFRIDKDQIATVLKKFDDQDLTKTDGKLTDGDYLIRIRSEGDNAASSDPIIYTLDYETDQNTGMINYLGPKAAVLSRRVKWDFDPDSLMDARAAEEKVTINAYQAFGNGTPLDLADALVRYSPTVRGTHVDQRVEDFPIYWGGDDCVITEVTGVDTDGKEIENVIGTLKRTKNESGYDGGYTFIDQDGNPVAEDWYDPTGGKEYNLTQKFTYVSEEDRTNEFDIKVKLIVTKVTVTDVTAEGLYDTYLNNDELLPKTRSKLGLPDRVQLVTDVVPGRVSLTMPVEGWESPEGTTVAYDLTNLKGKNSGDTSDVLWTDPDNRIGDYELYAVSAYDTARNGVLVYNKSIIQAVYPWLTVNDEYRVTARRSILSIDTVIPSFRLEYVSTGEDGLLTLRMTKYVDGVKQPMKDDDVFRLKLPGGTIMTEKTTIVDNGWGYEWSQNDDGTYDLYLKGSNGDDAGWKLVQSSINLGGWFEAEVTEPDQETSDFVAAFVPERPNVYTETKEFSFQDNNAMLYPYYKDQATPPTYVTLPLGEEYTVPTTYDGTTGLEPGTLHSFKVNAWPDPNEVEDGNFGAFKEETDDAITWDGAEWSIADSDRDIQLKFGWRSYASSYTYTGFGTVTNPSGGLRYVCLHVQAQNENEPHKDEKVTLTYEGSGDAVIPEDVDADRLLRIIFDSQQVEYKYWQTVTLTLTNLGDEEINGIYIDNTGSYGCEGEFIITRQPSPKLAAHGSTTFDVTYVSNLPVGEHRAVRDQEHDPALEQPLKIYSDSGLLKQFEAVYKVTPGPMYRLKLEIVPSDGSRGTAKAVEGVYAGSPETLNSTPAPYTYAEGDLAWIYATPVDQYAVQEIYYFDDYGRKRPLKGYDVELPEGSHDVLTNVTMPDHDLTVYVVFDEPLYDKLRLQDLQGWSGKTADYMKVAEGYDDEGHMLPLRLHADDYAASADYTIVRSEEDYIYDQGISIPSTNDTYAGWDVLQKPDEVYQLEESAYLVVIPADAAQSQVRLELRDVAKSIQPKIAINYGYGLDLETYNYDAPDAGDAQLRHISAVFNSPPQGERMTATITLSAENTAEGEVERIYYLIFARLKDGAPSYPMTAGNSPYGMIEWDKALTDKTSAKEAFTEGDRFAAGSTPAAAESASMDKIYWTEAWADGENYDRVDEALFVFAGEAFEDFGPVEDKVKNSGGDIVANQDITRSLTVVLRKDGATQKTAFEGSDRQTLDFGASASVEVTTVPADVWSDYKVRPGVYEMEYSYIDLDGSTVTFTRPLIVLDRLGNVDADSEPTDLDADAAMIESRVSSPLGYEAEGYTDRQLYTLRVCDANNDRNINNIDANTIRGGVGAQFYLPVGYSGK